MGQKLVGNGLWESSRMVLPEHREQMINQRERDAKARIKRPLLDETQYMEISERLQESIDAKSELTLHVWNRLNPVSGVVDRVDVLTRKVKIGGEWVKLDDIVKVE